MVYAYDLGMQLPFGDIRNTQMMLAQVAAAKDMYEKAALEMKDFKKEYGDFYSSRPGDMDWYNSEITKLKNTINDLYARGLDPLRSIEGRVAMARARDEFDIAQYASRKKSAAVYDEYMKNKAQLERLGLYDPKFEEYMMNKEGVSFTDSVFNRVSPTPYLNEINLTNDIFSGMKPEYIRTDEQGIDWEGITPERRKIALDAQLDNIINTPSGEYMYQLVKRQLGVDASEEQIRNALSNRIIAATHAKWDQETPDFKRKEVGLRQQEIGLKYQQMRQSQFNADRQFALDLLKNGISVDPKTGKFVAASDNSDYVLPMEQRLIDKIVNSRTEALSNYQQMFADAIRNEQATIDKYEKERTASTVGYKEIKSLGYDIHVTPSGYTLYSPKQIIQRKPYIKDKNSEEELARMKKNADVARYRIKAYEHLMNSDPKELIKYKYLNEDGTPTAQYTKLMAKTYLNKERFSSLSKDEKKETVHGLFNSLYSAGSLSEGTFSDWRSKQFANGNVEKLPGTKDVLLVSTKTGNYRYAPVYEGLALGIKSDPNSMEKRMDMWLLDNIPAWVWDEKLAQDYFLPSKGGEKYATSNSIVVSKEHLEDFAKRYGYSLDKVVKEQKLKTHVYKNDIGNAISAQYYEIPVFLDIYNNGGFNYYRINKQVNKADFGTSQSTKDRADAQRQSVMN